MSFLAPWLLLAAYLFFLTRRVPRYLHMFQQDAYDARRFLGWVIRTKALDRRVSLALLVLGIAALVVPEWGDVLTLGAAVVLFAFALREPDPRKEAKKKFVMTSRARRIFAASLVLGLGAGLLAGASSTLLVWVVAVQVVPLLIVLGDLLLTPLENRIQKRFRDEASAKLEQIHPAVIGITGSFGKTSVKHILGHILELNAPTLYTPGSVNTLMGIARIIREQLRAGCRYFLVEMGAYGPGSIQRLCDFTPPQVGVITALGEAHYERFKTLDNVAHAKFELAEAALRHPHGKVVVHENVLQQPYARDFIAARRERFVICGTQPDADVVIGPVEQTASGVTVTAHREGQDYTLVAPLFGTHHADNMVLAFATAVSLGVTPARAVAAMRSVPQITHRLEVKPQPDGTIVIDDAFNSNPRGFRGAVELLSVLQASTGGRRILVTPGVAELGTKNDEVHRELGAIAARHADVAIVVRPDRIPAFAPSFRAAAPERTLLEVSGLAEALRWLKDNAQPKDIVLYENDLPDLQERRLKL